METESSAAETMAMTKHSETGGEKRKAQVVIDEVSVLCV